MNCRDFETLASAMARNHMLDATIREQGTKHTEVCDRCATRLTEERALFAGVRLVVEELASQSAPAHIEAAMLSAFRARTTAPISPTEISISGLGRRWSGRKLTAIAAGLLLLISVVAVFWRSTSSFKPQREEQALMPTPGAQFPIKPLEPPVGRDQVVSQRTEKQRKRAHRTASGGSLDEPEMVTQFFPLREGEDFTALESVRLVRVELPGSALSEVGLPVDPEMVNEPIKADVMLGQDGLARAIRFVR